MRFLYFILSLWIGILSAHSSLYAQPAIDSRGKDFWLTFMPNFHQNINTDSLYIFIAATSPTQGNITYRNRQGASFQQNFSIVDTNRIYTFKVAYSGYELEGFNRSGTFLNSSQNETIAPQSFHITAQNEVTVYALSQAVKTSDAFLTLPTVALGTEYYVMTYRSDGTTLANNSISTQSTPSECAIVATEPNTTVHIIPSAPTAAGGLVPRDITLQQGDVFLIQAAITAANLRGDLTGTNITSTKPIAVFGGHQRARLPLENANNLVSRDFLCEEMPPLPTWGKNYFITPYPQPAAVAKVGSDIYRVLASQDNTVISLNGTPIIKLNKGQFYEAPLTQAGFISASSPILVAQFKKTALETQNIDVPSDPFMMIIPPREQYMKQYRCTNAQVRETTASSVTYTEQYITVIAPKQSLDSIKMDGLPIKPFYVENIPFAQSANLCLPYIYAWIRATDGVHSLESSIPFGLLVYGYGAANSYGYVGGMALNNDNRATAVTLGNDTAVCMGSSVQLLASGGNGTYRWSPPQGLSCTDCPNPIATPTQTTSYIAHSINDGGCDIADTIEVKVIVAMIDAGKDTSICVGDSIVLSPSGGVAYIWSPAEGLSCVACNQPTAKPLVTTTYYAIGTDQFGCIGMDSVIVRLEQLVVDAGNDTSICSGGAVQLHASSDGIRYSWTPSVGLSCTDCQSPIASPNTTTIYYVTVSRSLTCMGVDSVTVRIQTPTVDAGNDTSICKGGSVQLHASNGIGYSWTPTIGLSCTDCQSPIASPNTTTSYTVTVTVSAGCVAKDSVVVQVLEIKTDAGADTTICYGSAAQLHASGSILYKWSPPDGLSCIDCPSPMAKPNKTTTYHLFASGNGCIGEDSVTVTVNIPIAKAWGDTTICYGVPAQIHSSGGVSYKWSPADGLSCTDCASPMASPSRFTTYTVQVVNSLGCSAYDSVKIRVKDCKPTTYTYGSLLLCDSAETMIWIRNREDTPTFLQKIIPINNSLGGDGFSLTLPQLPYVIQAFDSVGIIAHFRPKEQRSYTAEYQVFTSQDSLQYIQLSGGGDFAKVALKLEHDSISAPGNKVFPIKISARCNNWEKAKVRNFTIDFRYTRERILFDSIINVFTKGSALDGSWNFSAREVIEPKDVRVLRIEANGNTPLSTDGILAEGSIGILLGDSAAYSPTLTMDIPDRSGCIQFSSTVGNIELYSCFMLGRFVRFGSVVYSLAAQEHTVDYAVGLSGNIRLELYNSLGELVRVLYDGHSAEGMFRLELPDIASGLYAVRMKAGQFTDIKPVIIVR
jgi:hypothetical protein